MFVKKFNSFLNESLELKNGNIIDEEDVKNIFHDFLEDLPEMKAAEISFVSTDDTFVSYGFRKSGADFQINFTFTKSRILDKKSDLYVRFHGFFNIPHDPLFKSNILDEIDERMQDQFGYQLVDKTWYGGENYIALGFMFGKIDKNFKRDDKGEKSRFIHSTHSIKQPKWF